MNFFDKAKKNGWIRPLEEAFIKYPPEEEIHRGHPFYVQEAVVKYNEYQIGDLVYVKHYHYKNGNPGMNHLFVIIDKNIAVNAEYLSMILSSKVHKQKYKGNVLLKKDNINNLKQDSIVKADQLYTITNKQIIGAIGKVSLEEVEKYKEIRELITN